MYRPWDFLGHLERTQRSGKLSHSLLLFLVTNEEQDNTGCSQHGNGYFRPATPGLGGAGPARGGRWSYTQREPGQLTCEAQTTSLSGPHL